MNKEFKPGLRPVSPRQPMIRCLFRFTDPSGTEWECTDGAVYGMLYCEAHQALKDEKMAAKKAALKRKWYQIF